MFSEFETPCLDDMKDGMRCGVFTDSKGAVLIVHDQPLKSEVEFVEYDMDAGMLTLVYEGGQYQPLGFKLSEKTKSNLAQAQNVVMGHYSKEKITHRCSVAVVVTSH